MTSLRLSLDDTDFAALFEIARSQIPAITPQWTDHNTHDPGIMLLELMAWVADQEIYALGRMRLDERFGYAALAGLRPAGTAPARGLVWPTTDPSSAAPSLNAGIYLNEHDPVMPERPDAPPFALDHGLYLTPATLTGIQTISPDDARVDWPLDGISPGAPLLAFGTRPARGARLELGLTGALLSSLPGPHQRPILSVGFSVEESQDGDAPEARQGRISARLQAELAWPGQSIRLPIVHDRSSGFTHTGILLLDLTGVTPGPLPVETVLRLTLRSPSLPVAPRLTAVAFNVLPVRQEQARTLTGSSTGLPDQEFSLDRDDSDPTLSVDHRQVRFGKGVAPLTVVVNTLAAQGHWQPRDDLSDAGPNDEVFVFDPASGVVRFGNGINGAIPLVGADLEVSCILCQGEAGNLPAGLAWSVDGRRGFANIEPIRGGTDLIEIDELRRDARQHVRDDRPLVTNADLETAAKACMDLRVARAQVLPGFDPNRVRGQAGRSRTLVVVSSDPSRGENGAVPETAAWLRALRRRLTPRLPVGDRVRIIGPRYIPLRLRATLKVAPNRDVAAVANKARRLLQARLAAVPVGQGDPFWLLGRDVEPNDLKGWLRKLEGVVAVAEMRIGTTPARLGDKAVKIPPHGLPQLTMEPGDITAVTATRGGQP